MADVGQRVLISGMGGEIGSRVASLLENEPWVESLEGIDADPPRRRLRRAVYHRIVPGDHDRIVDVVTRFDPHVLVHLAVWEPHSRANPDRARLLTDDAATSILGAAAECRSLESIVVRSGIEIYGRARGSVTRPDEAARINPTSGFGKMLAGIELTATTIGTRIGVAVGALRFAPVIGPHVPSPLGRYLRMAAVPFSALADPPFAVVQEIDVAAAFVAAARIRLAEPVNIVAPGAITAFHAIRRGRRVPVPMIGPEWAIARGFSYLAGAPVPDHVLELMHRGRLADGGRALEVLGVAPTNTTREVIDKLYSWPSVVHTPARGGCVMDRLADVISLPARRAASTLAGGARSTYDNVVDSSRHMVDDWGRDPDFVARIWSLSRLRWDVAVNGHDRLPKRAGALIVVSTRRFALAPVFAALSIGGAVTRPVRFVGRPDIVPLGPIMQRLGGLLTRADEIAGALRGGQLVVMGADPTRHPRLVGHVDHRLVGAAVAAGTKVFPAATASVPFLRSARVEIGPEVRPDRRRRGPLTELELADALESAIQQLLDELAGPVTGTPLDWLPLSVIGGADMTYARAVDGVRLHYETTGRRGGPPVLLIQGLGADKHGWTLQRLALATRYRTVAFDNRGAGRSDKPHGPYSLAQMADDAIAVLDDAGIESAHVVGASMGGAIAQLVALIYPERTRSLTLTCTSCRNHPWRRDLISGWAETARASGMASMTSEAARWVIGPRSFRRLWPAIGWMGPLAFTRPAHAFAAQCDAILAADDAMADDLARITIPTLVVVGNQDILTPRGDSEELAELIPTAELVVISGAAHGVMIEHASTYNRVLIDFLVRAEASYRERVDEPTQTAAAAS